MSELTLTSDCLLSKWGFNDGDCPDDLYDWCEAQGFDIDPWPKVRHWHAVLVRLVRERLVPALDQAVEVAEITTNHNPIRATTVEGVDVSECWYHNDAKTALTPESITVSYDDIMAAARQIYQETGGEELDKRFIPYLEGLADGGVAGAQELIDAIRKHGSIEIWIER